jgi:hypothetical protein
MQVNASEIAAEDRMDFHSGETFWTYSNIKDRSIAAEIAKWFCPKDYIVVYDYTKQLVHVRGTGKSKKESRDPDPNFMMFRKTPSSTARPVARYIRLDKAVKTGTTLLKILQIEVFDYYGNKIVPVAVVLSPQTNVALSSALVDGDTSASKAVVAETQPARQVYMQLDLGSDVEVAGVAIYNVPAPGGRELLEANLKLVTRSGVAVFNCPIRDTRLLYNIRTSPLEMKSRQEYGYFNEQFFTIPGTCTVYT